MIPEQSLGIGCVTQPTSFISLLLVSLLGVLVVWLSRVLPVLLVEQLWACLLGLNFLTWPIRPCSLRILSESSKLVELKMLLCKLVISVIGTRMLQEHIMMLSSVEISLKLIAKPGTSCR